jgi:hypothetical protein
VRFKVVSEEWYAAVDVARPPRVELRPGSSRCSVIWRSFWCLGALCRNSTSARGPAWRQLFRCGAVGSSADFCRRMAGVGKSAMVSTEFEDDGVMVEESRWLLGLQRTTSASSACRGWFVRDIVGDDGACEVGCCRLLLG